MKERIVTLAAVVMVSAALAGCSESSTDDTSDTPTGASDGGASDDGATGHDATSPGTDGSSPNPDAAITSETGVGSVVINEISGKGDNWVELFNAGSAAFDLGGYALADTAKDGGGPSFDDAVVFPSGTTLSPNSYAVVAELPSDAGANAPAQCPDGGQSYCFGATWGISNSRGETVYILDGQQNVAAEADYPANTVQSGQTWGRIPNGTGTFGTNLPTPGAANQAN